MNNKLIISDFYNNKLLGFILNDNNLEQIIDLDENSKINNIYCGYVKDVVKNIEAAFVEFDKENKGYIALKDCINFLNPSEKIKTGDKILVQVKSDKIKTKEYSLTSKITLNSLALVLVADGSGVHISRKISDKGQRQRLKDLLSGVITEEVGFICRTNCTLLSDEDIISQSLNLMEQWKSIKNKFIFSTVKTEILIQDRQILSCKNFIDKYDGEIITDNITLTNKLKDNNIKCTLNREDKISLCNKYALDKKIKESTDKKIWLKSGAYILIEPTETLTVIDVNTGKADLKKDKQKTLLTVNLEAAKEIMRQLTIRNISGIIIIDFINMTEQSDYIQLKSLMEKHALLDSVQCNVLGFTQLGLMEITRKKINRPLGQILKNTGE